MPASLSRFACFPRQIGPAWPHFEEALSRHALNPSRLSRCRYKQVRFDAGPGCSGPLESLPAAIPPQYAASSFPVKLILFLFSMLSASASSWEPVVWQGERAFRLRTAAWEAIVSVERARLVSLAAADTPTENLLLTAADQKHPLGFGGHRLWLGPQVSWSSVWPPPKEWEMSAASEVEVSGASLTLILPATKDSWGQLRRHYFPAGEALRCEAEVSGAARPVQFMQIIQTPPSSVVTVPARVSAEWPAAYAPVSVTSTARPPSVFPEFSQVSRSGDFLSVRLTGQVGKFGFPPAPLRIQKGTTILECRPGPYSGTVVEFPDGGLTTQVYVGSPANGLVVELEQLSPLLAPPSARHAFDLAVQRLP